MNQMEIFKNPEFGSIRVIEENGKYLFCGTDVAAALGYSNSRDAIIRHCRYVVKRDAPHPQSPDRKISMTFIPEGDLYRLIVHSKLPSAEQFEQWVFDEVLPTIRKHGAYLTKEKLWEVATSPEAMMKLCSDLLAEREENAALREENAMLEGKAAFYDLFIDLKHSTNLRTTAKERGAIRRIQRRTRTQALGQIRVGDERPAEADQVSPAFGQCLAVVRTRGVGHDQVIIHGQMALRRLRSSGCGCR